ncbi:unnamed protein product [Scytosiphon promiscuus]
MVTTPGMHRHRRNARKTGHNDSSGGAMSPMSQGWRFKALLSLISFLMMLAGASAAEGFSSFSFNGFNGFNSPVDNEGYYKVLGVGKTVDAGSITKAYRKLAKKKHPDKGGDPEEFKALAEAYEVLSDPKKRRLYDQVGKEGLKAGGGGGAGMDQSGQQADLFRSFFGRFSQPQPVRMRDVVYEMEVTLEELCHGGTKVVRIWSEGAVEGAGGRRERVSRDIEIGLTPGMTTGTRIVMEGGVEPIEEGIEPGDLIFMLRETRHRTFRRLTTESPHLTADITVTLSEALTGFVRVINLVDGRTVVFKTKEGEIVSPGAVRKLPGCGMPLGGGGGERGTQSGDLYLRFEVEFPSQEASAGWSDQDRKELQGLLPPKPAVPKEKPGNPTVELQKAEPNVASRFKAGLYDQPARGPSARSGGGGAWGNGGGGNGYPFGFFGL